MVSFPWATSRKSNTAATTTLLGNKVADSPGSRSSPSESQSNDGRDPSQSASRSSHKPGVKATLARWTTEFLGLFGAALALLALFVFLGTYNGKPRPQWPYEITINTVVAIFGIILKACMLIPIAEGVSQLKWMWYHQARSLRDLEVFDAASRGINGSLRLIFVLRARHFAAVGALITILAFAIDPFLQQTVVYYQELRPEPHGTATVPIARQYQGQDFNQTSDNDESLVGTIYDSLLNPNGEQTPLRPDCASGNCAFQDLYSSLAICSKCKNVSPLLSSTWSNTSFWIGNGIDENGGYWEFMGLNVTLLGEDDNSGAKLSLSLSPIRDHDAMAVTADLMPTMEQFNQTLYGIPQSVASHMHPNVMIDAASMPFLAVWSIAATHGEGCTNDWMKGGLEQPDTDCFDPVMFGNGFDPAAPTANWLSQHPNVTGDEVYKHPHLEGNINVPLRHFPKITSNLCTLAVCSQTYEANVTDGDLSETIISEDSVLWLTNHTNNPPGTFQDAETIPSTNVFIPARCAVNGSMHAIDEFVDLDSVLRNDSQSEGISGIHYVKRAPEAGGSGPTGDDSGYRNWTLVQETSPNPNLLQACTYSLSTIAGVGGPSSSRLGPLFAGAGSISYFPSDKTQVDPVINPWTGYSQQNWGNSQQLVSLFNGGNSSKSSMEANFQTVAKALTNHLRANDVNTVTGTSLVMETYVRVNLLWLILPAVLVVTTCFFLLTTIIKARRAMGHKIWTSNQTAMLLHGLSDREQFASMEDTKDMEKFAKTTFVRWGMEDAGWRLVKTNKGT
ncbi:MAG: hypothetical protein Q9159_006891 [Coniocarpon cinnabarinum]